MSEQSVEVRGAATPEEVAAVLAALPQRSRATVTDDRFARWRRQRQDLVRDNR